jgi:hypothetical protein
MPKENWDKTDDGKHDIKETNANASNHPTAMEHGTSKR